MKQYRAAIVGAGFIGSAHAEALRRLDNVQIVALCDAASAPERARQMGIPAAYADFRQMLDQEQPDVVHICTPNHTHAQIVRCAIEHGVNFICEKPFTTSVEEARTLAAQARERGVRGAVNFHHRLYPMTNEMHQIAAAGELGDIYAVQGTYVQDWLFHDTDYSWRLDKSQVGKTRAVADIGSHWMDLTEFVTGQKIVSVNAAFRTVHPIRRRPVNAAKTFEACQSEGKWESIPIDTEDEAVLLFRLANGAIGTALFSMVFAGKKNTATLSISGSRKSLSWSSESLNDLWIGYRDKANELLTKDVPLMHPQAAALCGYPGGHIEGFPDAFKNVFRQFYRSLSESGVYDYATPEDGLHEMLLCEAIWHSAQTGNWQEVGI